MKLWRVFSVFAIAVMLLVLGTGIAFADEETPEEEPEGEGVGQNPVALYIAGHLGVDYDDIREYQANDIGLGNISKAIYIQSMLGGEIGEILAAVQDMGWGEYYKSLEIKPGGGHGLGWMFKEYGKKEKLHHGKPEWAGGPPAHANNDKDKNKNKNWNKDEGEDED
jgi:hypothetical protein